jgi:hypothetical protein
VKPLARIPIGESCSKGHLLAFSKRGKLRIFTEKDSSPAGVAGGYLKLREFAVTYNGTVWYPEKKGKKK